VRVKMGVPAMCVSLRKEKWEGSPEEGIYISEEDIYIYMYIYMYTYVYGCRLRKQ
jgi:hypothetical protein